MEDPPVTQDSDQAWADQFAQTLSRQRSRVQEVLARQRARLDKAETELADEIEQVTASSEHDRAETTRARQEIDDREKQLERQVEALARLKEDLEGRQADWEQVHQRTLKQYEAFSGQIQSQCDRQIEDLAAQMEKQLDEQRRRIERQSAELETAETRQTELVTQIESGRLREAELNSELDTLRRRCDQLEKLAENPRQEDAGDQHELADLRQERNRLTERLSNTEEKLAATVQRLAEAETKLVEVETELAAVPAAESDDSTDDFRRRYEMALDDLRQAKNRADGLESQLAQAQQRGVQAPPPSGQRLDWESEKRRILDALEPDSDDADPDRAATRVKIEDVVRRTDRIVAEKQREIDNLEKLLEAQSANHDKVAVGAAAIGQVLDNDAVIQDERENLQRLQQEWEEKLRRAEIDNSIERAKMARERSSLDEKVRSLEEQGGRLDGNSDQSAGPDNSGTKKRGRWLSLLGLQDD